MMTVNEYAEDMNKTIDDVLNKCKVLGIVATDADTELDDDAIVLLDNSWDEDLVADEETLADIAFEEAVEELVEEHDFEAKHATAKKQKIKPKDKKNIASLKKDMYKNKAKLTSNVGKKDAAVILYEENMTVEELAKRLEVSVVDVITKLMNLGNVTNKNASINFEEAEILTAEYDKVLKLAKTQDIASFENLEIEENEADLEVRPPVITIMGHVDHGKTTLLDTIRSASVAEGEAGGITQHISAYQIEHDGRKITFIDTPGHAAFTEMRARGASVTDIIIIIVAADDGIMPQTLEVIDHAKAANVPIIVAINKIDKEGANPDRIMTEMGEHGLMSDEWGGDTLFVKVSAKENQGIDELLQNILLIADMGEYKANPNRYATGTVIESRQDKSSGNVVTVLPSSGTLRLGDPIVIGTGAGKVRTMKNDLGEEIVAAGPSTPVEITGISAMPMAGDKFMAFETEKEAKSIAEKRTAAAKLEKQVPSKLCFDEMFASIKEGNKEVNVIVKADVKGSEEAVKNALTKLNIEEVTVKVIRSGVGTITESDVVLANASNAVILGFNVKPSKDTEDYAKEQGIDIRLYNIIYKLIEDIEKAMKGMLDPIYEEKVIGGAEVKQIFRFSKVGLIAGSMVTSGIVKRKARARLLRGDKLIIDTVIASVQREKDQVKEVKKGLECGITLEDADDIKEGDIIEVYEMIEVER